MARSKLNGHKPTDSLLAAVIEKLPPTDQPFPAEARKSWLEMMEMAFDVAYGPVDAQAAKADQSPTGPAARTAHDLAGCDFYVDKDGLALCDFRKDDSGRSIPTPGRRVLPDEIDDEPIYDYRGTARDRSTVKWADDTIGARPGMNFCGPG